MRHLGVFAKYWDPGTVKTRLALTIGDAAAAEIYRSLLTTTLRRCEAVEAIRILACWPPERQPEMMTLTHGRWCVEQQSKGDLGARMQHFFEKRLESPDSRAVLIGSDSPQIPLQRIEAAFVALASSPVVIGPSEDGGYYLIGATRVIPEMFADIDWSSDQVMHQTVNQLKSTGAPYAVLPTEYDIDEQADLQRLCQELQQLKSRDPHLDQLLAELMVIESQGR